MSGTGMWRWATWGNAEQWHLRVGNDVGTLCDRTVMTSARHKELKDGPPARRCSDCLDIAAHRLGIVRADQLAVWRSGL